MRSMNHSGRVVIDESLLHIPGLVLVEDRKSPLFSHLKAVLQNTRMQKFCIFVEQPDKVLSQFRHKILGCLVMSPHLLDVCLT